MNKVLLFIASLFIVTSFAVNAEQSPFTDVTFDQAPSITVTYNSEVYFLLSINDVSREDIMTKCEASYAETCQENFSVNFLETMLDTGVAVTGNTVKLVLYQFATHQVLTVEDAALTQENVDDIIFNRDLRGE